MYQFLGNNFKYVNNAVNGTTGNVFTIRTLHTVQSAYNIFLPHSRHPQEKFRAEGKLYSGFVDLEKKTFDKVLREVIRWEMHKLGVEELLISVVISMYTGAKTVKRTVYGNSNGFEVNVGMHQGLALSPLLFVMVMEALSREFRVALQWKLLYADDLVVTAETQDDLITR